MDVFLPRIHFCTHRRTMTGLRNFLHRKQVQNNTTLTGTLGMFVFNIYFSCNNVKQIVSRLILNSKGSDNKYPIIPEVSLLMQCQFEKLFDEN